MASSHQHQRENLFAGVKNSGLWLRNQVGEQAIISIVTFCVWINFTQLR